MLCYGASQMVIVVKDPSAKAGDVKNTGLIPGVRKIPWGKAWQPTPVFLPEEIPRREEPGGL